MRVLVVDDSALMRRWLKECFASEPGIESLTARDGKDALAKLDSFDPDVVTLDINMPEMDGLTCLAQIMARAPRPVVMLSSLTDAGALATLEALELGAVDYIAKPSGTVSHDLKLIFPQILAKVRAAARIRVTGPKRPSRRPAAPPRPDAGPRPAAAPQGAARHDLVLIGSSTGGPKALEAVLFPLGPDFPVPILIAQHMPKRFTKVFAERLTQQGALPVIEVTGPTELRPGAAYLAQGDADVQVSRRRDRLVATPVPANPELVWNPSVNHMVATAQAVLPPGRLLAVLLTGMGDDGAAAMTRLHQAGGTTIAQSEASSAIFGMPRALIEAGGASRIIDVDRIAYTLMRLVAG
ncbi:chemotaxis response regulator protein-glutamate methylesterase [Rhodobacter sp. Har01]|uniref:protein-glutamate methylesterase/protein-glutamine glutaminase n=1 Tax=Rhodobacter sp. Har01 TaxID=2883999 RepID=UPI001D07DE73|nr:chemotaxis response regulator protein-glutamate methylesterase [Rhodobacter sp. Har01]MCB6179267.1 chemotaxis response regulator protein-glutamate methylesterase [Rhodobacter sp. Har01]